MKDRGGGLGEGCLREGEWLLILRNVRSGDDNVRELQRALTVLAAGRYAPAPTATATGRIPSSSPRRTAGLAECIARVAHTGASLPAWRTSDGGVW